MRCYGALVLGLAGLLFFHCEAATAGACPDPREDFGAIKKRFDPKNEWGESAANIHIIGALYQYKMSKGDIDGAACSAFQMIQYHRQAQQRYAVIVECAAHIGDLDTRCRAAMTTYQKLLPDANDIKFQPTHDGHLSYTYVDGKTGKTMLQAVDTVDKLASTAMGFAENSFDKALLTTAEPEITRRSVQGVAPAKPKEMLRVPMVQGPPQSIHGPSGDHVELLGVDRLHHRVETGPLVPTLRSADAGILIDFPDFPA